MTGNLTATTTSTAIGGRGGAITYSITAGSGSATVNASTGFIQAVGIGTVTLRANSAGDADYNASNTGQLITIGKSGQVLMITSSNAMVVDGTLVASVTSSVSNGGTIIYSIKNGRGAVLVNPRTGLIQATMHGTVTLIASTAGNSSYMPATTSQVITIGKSTPTLTITSPNNMLVGQSLRARVNTTATYERGGGKSYSILAGSGSATVNSSTGFIHAIGSGTVTLVVSSAGDADYNASSSSQLITISNDGVMLVVVPNKEDSGDDLISPPIDPVPSLFISSPEDHVKDHEIVISKAVSPNGDGLDDTFIIQNIENYPTNEVVIANRKGEVMFKAQSYNNDRIVFAGVSNNGAELLDGIYYYTIVFYDQGKMNRLVGHFKLRRRIPRKYNSFGIVFTGVYLSESGVLLLFGNPDCINLETSFFQETLPFKNYFFNKWE